MNNSGWFKTNAARFLAAGGLGMAVGFGTLVAAHAAASPAPTVSPDASPSTTPGSGSGTTTHHCPNM